MTSNESTPSDDEYELDLGALFRMAWDSKYTILLCSALCAMVAVYVALTATPIYRAEAVVAEVHDSNMSGAASLANQLGGIASLAGINLPTGDEAGHEAQAILQSRRLVEEFVQREGLLPDLKENSSKTLTLWRAVNQFRDNVLTVREDKRTGLTKITIEWRDPATAANWANKFVAFANEVLRTRALNDSTRNIEYLNKQIAKTTAVEVQRVMYNLIESETKTLMLANARVEYAFTVVDPAVSPEMRIRPQRSIMVIEGTMIGAITGFVIVLVRRRLNLPRRGSLVRR
jgi:LPS O-antigen subunit length determinant protein (WzzB/FepE family)